MNPTREEQRAIRDLQRLAVRWPSTLWLFVTPEAVNVMRYGPNGERMVLPLPEPEYAGYASGSGGGFDPRYLVETIHFPVDGGDW